MKQKGFTLIELLVVIAIIGILSTVVIGELNVVREKAQVSKFVQEMNQIKLALELYKSEYGEYPNILSSAVLLNEIIGGNWGENQEEGLYPKFFSKDSIDMPDFVDTYSFISFGYFQSPYNPYPKGENYSKGCGSIDFESGVGIPYEYLIMIPVKSGINLPYKNWFYQNNNSNSIEKMERVYCITP